MRSSKRQLKRTRSIIRKVARHLEGVRWAITAMKQPDFPGKWHHVMALRFDGGRGLLMMLDSEAAQRRIEAARLHGRDGRREGDGG